MNTTLEQVNAELSSLIDAYGAGTLAAGEYRQRRRVLVCQISGEAVPEVENEGSAECTLPGGMAAVQLTDKPVAVVEPASEQAPQEEVPRKSNALYWFVTAVTLLVAIAGVGGLFWYIFRQ